MSDKNCTTQTRKGHNLYLRVNILTAIFRSPNLEAQSKDSYSVQFHCCMYKMIPYVVPVASCYYYIII